MSDWQIVLLTGAVGVITALVTSTITHRNEVKRQITQNRANLYFDFCNQAEKLLNNRFAVYDREYIDAILTFKPKFKLLASNKTIDAFKDLYNFILEYFKKYMEYCDMCDPRRDPDLSYTYYDEDGVEQQASNAPNYMIAEFKNDVENFKRKNAPNIQTISPYITVLYDKMRRDLGNNTK